MQITRFMDGFNRPQQRRQHATDPGLIYRLRMTFAEVRERGAAVEHRAHVGGVVLHPETQHVQQVRMIKARQQPRLLDKTVQSGVKRFAKALAAQHQVQVIAAHRQRGRHELFDGDITLKLVIPGAIDDAKAATADDLFDFKLIEAVTQRQSVGDIQGLIMFRHIRKLSDD